MLDNDYSKLPAEQKIALLLVGLGSHTASKVVRLLTPDEIKKLSFWIKKDQKINPAWLINSVQEFYTYLGETEGLHHDGDRYLQEVLSYAFGEKKKDFSSEKPLESNQSVEVSIEEVLQSVSLQELTAFLSDEPVESLAIMLYNLENQRAYEIFSHLPREKQVEVITALAIMDNIDLESQQNILKTSAEVFKKSATRLENPKNGFMIKSAKLLNSLPQPDMKAVLAEIERSNSLLACQIRNQCFTYNELVKAPDELVKAITESVEALDVLLALKESPDDVKEKFLSQIPRKNLEQANKEIEDLGPITPFIVESAQRKLLRVIQEAQGVIQ
jgi:flagellar motor switch protein FliG